MTSEVAQPQVPESLSTFEVQESDDALLKISLASTDSFEMLDKLRARLIQYGKLTFDKRTDDQAKNFASAVIKKLKSEKERLGYVQGMDEINKLADEVEKVAKELLKNIQNTPSSSRQ